MKHTYKEKYLDITLIIVSSLFFLDSVIIAFNKADYFSFILLRIVWLTASIVSLVSLIATKMDGERYSRFFIIVNFLIPSILVIVHFLTDLMFYGIARTDHLQNLPLYIKLMIGMILLILSIRLSRQQATKRNRDYGLLSVFVGIFVLVYAISMLFEFDLVRFTDISFIIRIIIGLLLVFLGFRLANGKMKLKTFLILLSGLTVIGAGTI